MAVRRILGAQVLVDGSPRRETELRPGDRVVVAGHRRLRQGQAVLMQASPAPMGIEDQACQPS